MCGRVVNEMKKWIPCELHTHTVHSDGNLTLTELAKKARDMGISCIALTDHNTISGHLERDKAQAESGIDIVRGLEWTTFYGHMIAMGIDGYVDWRGIGPGDIDEGIANIHRAGGLAGVAHPFCMGSPMCTGCYWSFEIKDWSKVDYIEVWSEPFPSIEEKNIRAFRLWTDLLNRGYRLTAVSGRDWHGDDCGKDPVAVTYLEIREDAEDMEKAVKEAIAGGRASVTMGPLLTMQAGTERESSVFSSGDTVYMNTNDEKIKVIVKIDFFAGENIHVLDEKNMRVILESNKGKLGDIPVSYEMNKVSFTLSSEDIKWLRAELHGKICGINAMIAFTNPIYFCKKNQEG